MVKNNLEIALQKAAERKELTDRFKKVLIKKLKLQYEPEEISEDSSFFGMGLGLDSIDTLEIAVATEEEFGVSLTEKDMAAFRSINAMIDFIIIQSKGRVQSEQLI